MKINIFNVAKRGSVAIGFGYQKYPDRKALHIALLFWLIEFSF